MKNALEILKEFGSVTLEAYSKDSPDNLLERMEVRNESDVDDFFYMSYPYDYVYSIHP